MAHLLIVGTKDKEKVDENYRYKMVPIIGKKEGRGNGKKTAIPNCSQLARQLHRTPGAFCKFFGNELGAVSTWDPETDRAIVNGHIEDNVLQDLTYKFIDLFVLCPTCHLPETKLKIEGKKKSCEIFHVCHACGAKELVDMGHRLCAYLIKEKEAAKAKGGKDGGTKGGKDAKEVKKAKKAKKAAKLAEAEAAEKAAKEAKKKETPEEKEARRAARKLEKKAAKKAAKAADAAAGDDDDWGDADFSAQAVAARSGDLGAIDPTAGVPREERMGGAGGAGGAGGVLGEAAEGKDSDGSEEEEDPVGDAVETVSGKVSDGTVSMAALAGEIQTIQTNCGLPATDRIRILFGVMAREGLGPAIFGKYEPALEAISNTPEAQNLLIACLEQQLGVVDTTQAKMTPVFLKALYDIDALEEERITEWHSGASPSSFSFPDVSEEVCKLIKDKAQPFVSWLEEAEEDDDDEESDE